MVASNFIIFASNHKNVLDFTEAVVYVTRNVCINFQLNQTTEWKVVHLESSGKRRQKMNPFYLLLQDLTTFSSVVQLSWKLIEKVFVIQRTAPVKSNIFSWMRAKIIKFETTTVVQ